MTMHNAHGSICFDLLAPLPERTLSGSQHVIPQQPAAHGTERGTSNTTMKRVDAAHYRAKVHTL